MTTAHAAAGEAMAEPKRMGAHVIDRDGDLWRRGRTRWTCVAAVDGLRVQQVARLPWYALLSMYGPLRPQP